MLRHMCIVDRRLEFLATLLDSLDTVEAEEAAVGSMEVAGPSGELQDRPEQQEQLIRCVVEGVMAKGDKGISVSWSKNRMEVWDGSFVTLKDVGFIFIWAGEGSCVSFSQSCHGRLWILQVIAIVWLVSCYKITPLTFTMWAVHILHTGSISKERSWKENTTRFIVLWHFRKKNVTIKTEEETKKQKSTNMFYTWFLASYRIHDSWYGIFTYTYHKNQPEVWTWQVPRCAEVAVVSNLAPLLVVAMLELKMAEGLAMTLTNAGGAWWIDRIDRGNCQKLPKNMGPPLLWAWLKEKLMWMGNGDSTFLGGVFCCIPRVDGGAVWCCLCLCARRGHVVVWLFFFLIPR